MFVQRQSKTNVLFQFAHDTKSQSQLHTICRAFVTGHNCAYGWGFPFPNKSSGERAEITKEL